MAEGKKKKKPSRKKLSTVREITWGTYRPVEMHRVHRLTDPQMLRHGRWVRSYEAPELEVVDLDTGEMFRLVGTHVGERFHQREFVFSQMRAPVRHFAMFVLQFRNYRRGMSPGLDDLVHWYAELYDLRADNVRRYVATLKSIGFLETETLMGPLFQLSKSDMHPGEYLSEEFGSWARYTLMLGKKERLLEQRDEYIGKKRSWLSLASTLSSVPAPPLSDESTASTSEATCAPSRRPVRSDLEALLRASLSRCVADHEIEDSERLHDCMPV